MTREEAIDILKAIQAFICPNKESVLENNFSEAFDIAIEALTDRPKDCDCWGCNCPKMERQVLSDRPQGEWIEAEINGGGLPNPIFYVECSKCGWKKDIPTDFCPNCGARMKGGAE